MNTTNQPAIPWNRRINILALLRRPRVLFCLMAETIRLCCQAPTRSLAAQSKALKELWRVGTLNDTELDFLSTARLDLAPSVGFLKYCQRVIEVLILNLRTPVQRVSEVEYKEYLADPTGYAVRQPVAQRIFNVEMTGIERLRAAGGGRPVMLLAWHGGAQTHNFLRDLREQVPRLQVFSAYREMFVPYAAAHDLFFTTPLIENPTVRLLMMAKFFEEGRPVLLHFDGIAGKRDVVCRFFGQQVYLSRGFIHIARRCNPLVLPVTACFLNTEKVRAHIHPPLFSDEELQALTDEQLLDRTLRYFVDDLRKNAPAALPIRGHLTKLTKQTLSS